MRRLPAVMLSAALGLALVGGLAACSPLGAINAASPAGGLTVTRDLHYGPDPRNVLDVYAPRSAAAQNTATQNGGAQARRPVLLFIHGGSWTSGNKDEYAFVGASFGQAGYVTAVMSYRLAPQHRYPEYVQDAALALRWLHDHAAEYGGDPDRLFVSGHSAGAFNAVAVADDARFLAAAGVPKGVLRGVVGIAGPYSYDFRTDPTRNAFPPDATPEQVMPSDHVSPGSPPNLLLVAGDDHTVGAKNGTRMEAALKAAGVPVTLTVLPGLNHYTIVGSLARPLTWLGPTRQKVLDFLAAHQ